MIQDTLNLADGRTLSYSQWGPPDATPIFYFHGFPSSRHELELARPRLEQSNRRRNRADGSPGMDKAPIADTAKNRWFLRVQFAMLAFAFRKGQEDKFVANVAS